MKKGEVILESSPYAHVLSNSQRGLRCDHCFLRSSALKKCTACSFIRYCNAKCQKSDWLLHKVECKCLQRTAPNTPLDSLRLLLRIILRQKLKDKGENIPEKPKWRTFDDLQPNTEEIKKDAKRCEQFRQCVFTLGKLLDEKNLPPMNELLTLFGKMVTNSFTINCDDLQPIGTGIYINASALDHRCNPNAVGTFSGTRLQIRATKDIPDPVSPSNVFISYIEQFSTSPERRAALQEQYYFCCDCERCRDLSLDAEMMCIKCQKGDNCSGIHPQVDGMLKPCTSCGHLATDVDPAITQGLMGSWAESLSHIKELKSSQGPTAVIMACKEFQKKHEKYVTPYNIQVAGIYDLAFDAAIDVEDFELALSYDTSEVYCKLYPSYSPPVGLQLMRRGKLQLLLKECAPALKILQQAETILAITHGKSHDLYSHLQELLDQCQEELRLIHAAENS